MTIELTAPTKWSELTLEQFRQVVDTMFLHLTDAERLLCLFCIMTGVKIIGTEEDGSKTWFVMADGQCFSLDAGRLAYLCKRQQWLLDPPTGIVPNPTNLDDYLRDISFGDWFETDIHFRLYEDDGDLSHFNFILPKLKETVRPLTQSEAEVYHIWWNSIMGQLAPMYPNMFAKSESGGERNPFKTLQEIHLLLNDDRPQDNEKIDDSRLHDVLSALDSKIEKLKRREAEYNKIHS